MHAAGPVRFLDTNVSVRYMHNPVGTESLPKIQLGSFKEFPQPRLASRSI